MNVALIDFLDRVDLVEDRNVAFCNPVIKLLGTKVILGRKPVKTHPVALSCVILKGCHHQPADTTAPLIRFNPEIFKICDIAQCEGVGMDNQMGKPDDGLITRFSVVINCKPSLYRVVRVKDAGPQTVNDVI